MSGRSRGWKSSGIIILIHLIEKEFKMEVNELKTLLKKMIDENDISLIGVNTNYRAVQKAEDLITDIPEEESLKAFTLHIKLHKPAGGKEIRKIKEKDKPIIEEEDNE